MAQDGTEGMAGRAGTRAGWEAAALQRSHGAKAKITTALTEVLELHSPQGIRMFCNVLYVSTRAYQGRSAQVYRTFE